MKEIKLSRGLVTIVDDEDYEKVIKLKWSPVSKGRGKPDVYVRHRSRLYLHRFITDCPKGKQVDHINGNGLDNRRCNLRICEPGENSRNQKKRINNKSGYKGVSWIKDKKKWKSCICFNYKNIHLGFFDSIEEAASAYALASQKIHGKFKRV